MITVEPGLIGGEINKILERHYKKGKHPIQYKIGPDPSSIDSAMVGGMVSNNSSGMCCGVSQNTYHTLKDMRVVFADGSVLDTADPQSRQNFMQVGSFRIQPQISMLTHGWQVLELPAIRCIAASSGLIIWWSCQTIHWKLRIISVCRVPASHHMLNPRHGALACSIRNMVLQLALQLGLKLLVSRPL